MFGTCRQTCTTCSMLQSAQPDSNTLIWSALDHEGFREHIQGRFEERLPALGICQETARHRGTPEGPTSYCKIAAC